MAENSKPVAHGISHDDMCAFQQTLRLLELIASGWTYGKDSDLDGGMIRATIRHAMKHAQYALTDFKPAYMRLCDAHSTHPAKTEQPSLSDAWDRLRSALDDHYKASYRFGEGTNRPDYDDAKRAERVIIDLFSALLAQRPDSEQSRLMLADDTSPRIPQRPDSDKDGKSKQSIAEAVAYWNSKWPAELSSGVMFFKGQRITKQEFMNAAKGTEP